MHRLPKPELLQPTLQFGNKNDLTELHTNDDDKAVVALFDLLVMLAVLVRWSIRSCILCTRPYPSLTLKRGEIQCAVLVAGAASFLLEDQKLQALYKLIHTLTSHALNRSSREIVPNVERDMPDAYREDLAR